MAFMPASRAARTMSKSSASRGNRSGNGWQCRSTAPATSMSGPPYVRLVMPFPPWCWSESGDDGESERLVGVHRVQHRAGLLQRQRLADDPGWLQHCVLHQPEQSRVVHMRVPDAAGDLDLGLDNVVERYAHVTPLCLAGQADLDQPAALAQRQHRRLDERGHTNTADCQVSAAASDLFDGCDDVLRAGVDREYGALGLCLLQLGFGQVNRDDPAAERSSDLHRR